MLKNILTTIFYYDNIMEILNFILEVILNELAHNEDKICSKYTSDILFCLSFTFYLTYFHPLSYAHNICVTELKLK